MGRHARETKARALSFPIPRDEACDTGLVLWLTGLSGAGKTTVGRILFQNLKRANPATVLLDGDALRQAISEDLGHGAADRRRSAMRNARLCKLLADQGISVVCATISLFRECHDWNRRNIERYFEVYLKASQETRVARDPKGIYRRAFEGKADNVCGLDLAVEEPEQPHLVIGNDGEETPQQVAARILTALGTVGQHDG